MSKKKIVLTEILILLVLFLAILLPKIIGKTQVDIFDGYINDIESLDGHNIGITQNDVEKEIISSYLPNSEQIVFESIKEGVKAIEDGQIDALTCNIEDAKEAIKDNDDLVIYQTPLIRKFSEDAKKETVYYFVIRKEDCAYRATTQTLEEIYKPGVKIACLTGLEEGRILKELNPDCIIEYYDNYVDLFNALSNGKVDYSFGYNDNIKNILPSFPNVAAISEPFNLMNACFALSKTEEGNALTKEFDDFLYGLQKSGDYEKLTNKWLNGNENTYKLEDVSFTGEKGVLKICTSGTWIPNTFINNNEIVGVFIDICNLFCEEKGYIPEYEVTTFTGEIAGLSTGEYALMADLCEDTLERKEVVNFTRPALITATMIFTKADSSSSITVSKASIFFNNLKEKFRKNFIDQDRYKMVLQGLWTTIRISCFAAIFGTILGALICLMRKSKNIFCNAFARIYIKIIQGTPIVVVLLILYYIVFSNTGVTGFWVSVIGFTIDFSAYVCEIFRSGIEAIPEGQSIAARALGFSRVQAFTKVVLPQALINIVPVYSGQFISLIKATSIVGYIAVQDLTKVSDLIRGSTYEAFFPLISTAVIYFIISAILIQILNVITKKMDPLKRSRLPKGVKTNVI